MLAAEGRGKDKPRPALGRSAGELRHYTQACGSGQCLLSGIKRQRETWANSTAGADLQLDLSHRQDLGSWSGSGELRWGDMAGGWKEPRWTAGTFGKG